MNSFLLVLLASICEFIDSSLGMLYGTILSPFLIAVGFDPLLVVPSILFSQAVGGFTATIFHHRLKNIDFTLKSRDPKYISERLAQLGYKEAFKRGTTEDLKVAILVTTLGIIATIFSVFVAINIPKIALKTYIGVLVLLMGLLLLLGKNFKFSWKKITAIGILSAFNKGISGGGFGPVTTAGQVISGRDGKSSIGVTDFAEAPICLAGFLTYYLKKGIPNWNLLLLLTIGSIIGATIGPHFTAKLKSERKLKLILGILVTIEGIWALIETWLL